MSLSPGIAKNILEAAEDLEITHAEVTSMMTGVFGSAMVGMIMVFMATAFIKVANPPKKIAEEILEVAEVL